MKLENEVKQSYLSEFSGLKESMRNYSPIPFNSDTSDKTTKVKQLQHYRMEKNGSMHVRMLKA